MSIVRQKTMKFNYKSIIFELTVCFTSYVDSVDLADALENYNEADYLCVNSFKVESPSLIDRISYGTNKIFYGYFSECEHIPRSDDKLMRIITDNIKSKRICFEKEVFNDMLTHSSEIDFFLIGLDINDRRVDIIPVARSR